tara:strand:+ start:291 stop:938 length:648 start_codon:yes stop_codon:yes gene_type:complete
MNKLNIKNKIVKAEQALYEADGFDYTANVLLNLYNQDCKKRTSIQFKKYIKNGGSVRPLSNIGIQASAVMTQSFSMELILKSLLIIHCEGSHYGHKLDVLFNKLPDEVKKSIQNIYKNNKNIVNERKNIEKLKSTATTDYEKELCNIPLPPLSVAPLLKMHKDSFVEWRYDYENLSFNNNERKSKTMYFSAMKTLYEILREHSISGIEKLKLEVS